MSNQRQIKNYVMLRDAIKKKNIQRVRSLIQKDININTFDGKNNTLLHLAIIKFEDVDVLTMLLDKGANIYALNHNHDKPLEFAIKNNKTQAAVLLIEKGALVGENLRPLLLMAIEKNNHTIVRNLINYGMQYNPLLDLIIPFTVAVSQGKPQIIEHILPHCQFSKPSDKYIPRELVIKSGQQYKDCVELLLKWNFVINPTSNQDKNFVYAAIENGHLPIVLQLLKLGIDVDLKSSRTGLDLLKVACLNKHYEIAEHLLKNNASVNTTTPTSTRILNNPTYNYCSASLLFTYNTNNLCGLTCLHIAVLNSDPVMTKLLLKYGAKIVDDPKFFNITCIAVRNNCEDIVRIFLDRDVNVNDVDSEGRSLLHFCINTTALRPDYRYNIAKILLEKGASIHLQKQGSSLFFEAIKNGYQKIAQLFLDYNVKIQYISSDGFIPLHKAIEKDFDAEFIENLLKLNSPVDIVNNDMLTPLFIACKMNLKHQVDIIKILLQYKANINCTDSTSNTPLHIACQARNLEVITVLLENGANPNSANDEGQTPLHLVCAQKDAKDESTDEMTLKIIELLLQYNANIEAVDMKGWTPLFIACDANNQATIKFLLDNNANADHLDLKNLTPIYIAAQSSKYNSEIIKLLLERNVRVHSINNAKESIIHIIINRNDVKLIKSLARTQVSFNCANNEGDTPLHVAVQDGSLNMIKSLIKYGANINILNKKHQTPLQSAIKHLFESRKKFEKCLRRRYSIWDPSNLNTWHNSSDDDSDDYLYRINIQTYKQIIIYFKTQVVKLKIAGIEVNNRNLKTVYNSDDFSSDEEFPDGDNLDCSIDVLQLEVDCEMEIVKMQMENICVNKITFYDLLKNNLHFLRRFVNNKQIQKNLKLKIYDEKFPLYINIARSRFRDAKLLQGLIDSSKKYFNLNIDQRLPNDCLEMMFSYLNMKDIEMFIRAFEPLYRYDKTREILTYGLLIEAIKKSDKETARNMILNNVKVNNYTTQSSSPLHLAITQFEDLDIMTLLLDKGADIHAKDKHNKKPLHIAVENNKTEAALLLIEKGALVGEDLNPLLLTAIENNNHAIFQCLIDERQQSDQDIDFNSLFKSAISHGNPKILEQILPHCQFLKESDRYVPRELVVKAGYQYKECVEMLIKWGFIIDPTSNEDKDFVYGAVKYGHLQVVIQLLKLGIKIKMMKSSVELNLLKIACFNKHHEIVELLLKQDSCSDPTTCDNSGTIGKCYYHNGHEHNCPHSFLFDKNDACGRICLYIAVRNSDIKMTKLLLKYGATIVDDPKFFKITCLAIRNNCEEHVRLFLDHGVDVNGIDSEGRTLLNFCVFCSNHDLKYNIAKLLLEEGGTEHLQKQDSPLFFEAVKNGHRKIAQLFLDYNANVHYVSPEGNTALHKAVKRGFNVEFIENLLKLGLPVNVENDKMNTPLLVACKAEPDNQLEIVKLLLKYNANVNCSDSSSNTPLHIACQDQNLELIKILLESGANPNAVNEEDQTPMHFVCKEKTDDTGTIIELLLEYNANIEAVDAKDWTPIFYACEAVNDIAVRCLLDLQVDANHTDLDNLTPLYIAAKHCRYNSEIVKILLKHKVNVHCINKWGKSVIHAVVENDNAELVKYLARTQINFNTVNEDGRTPLHTAVRNKCVDVTKELIKYAGLKVNDQNMKLVYDNDTESHDEVVNQDDIDYRIDIPQLESDCEKEIERMKMENIGINNWTLYDFLEKSIHIMSRYVRNFQIQRTLNLRIYDERFPLYINIVRSRYRDAKLRYRLMDSAKNYFSSIISPRLSDDSMDAIFSYLNLQEIKMVIRILRPLKKQSALLNSN
ncbi:serine/threonine-protein phosphatase 6 regulatory ankyrin repeat subunit B-like [Chelonus insularis]|uniref:serine/threonine-protein phosphatase 6 regulatory ankyrin repeat subunit B-like n=1 Tax=Chelonus insularis TaxID=460826 RepID=UPI00158E3098|nr:serine/threonine-protein phosphatase 6 regulatory ankyrin repeat subunit B-like [Chelonus insularis]